MLGQFFGVLFLVVVGFMALLGFVRFLFFDS